MSAPETPQEAAYRSGKVAAYMELRERIITLIEVDFAGAFDDRRGLETLKTWTEDELRLIQP